MPPLGFNVVIVEPKGYVFNRAFLDIAKLLVESLRSLGHPVQQSVHRLLPECVNILLGYHVLPGTKVMKQARCIVYQLEQLSFRDRRFPEQGEKWLSLLEAARQVWDYSDENIALLRSRGFANVKRVPIGFHESMRQVPRDRHQDVDVLFYGQLNARRVAVLNELAKRCQVRVLVRVYGAERDDWIARSRIVLNMHFHDAEMFEQARVSYLLNNGRFVISEQAPDNPYGDGIIQAPYEQLVDRCLEYLGKPQERDEIALRGAELFQKLPMTDFIRAAIDGETWPA
ncbi:MAG: hypothetical protein ACREJC_18605 [Tepidisphaeraceae bacterium]